MLQQENGTASATLSLRQLLLRSWTVLIAPERTSAGAPNS